MSLGRYVIERELGRGGMGMVFEASDPILDRSVALKVLLPETVSNPEARSRFLKEGRSAAKFKHPNVVTIHDVGEADGFPFLVMEFLAGETLAERLARVPGNRLAAAETIRLLKPVFDAVATAHDAGIIHRDLKPENIFLVGAEDVARPIVLDFGIAKVVDDQNRTNQTATGQIIGTPRYMAPEQVGGGKDLVGPAADQYALGVITYECVAGRHPLGGDVSRLSILDMIARIAHTLPEPLQNVMPEAGTGFSLALARMLTRLPEQRFGSVREAMRALEGADSLEDPSARHKAPVSPSARTVPLVGAPLAGPAERRETAEAAGGWWPRRLSQLAALVIGLAIAGGGTIAVLRAIRRTPPNPAPSAVPERASAPVPRVERPAAAVAPPPSVPSAPAVPGEISPSPGGLVGPTPSRSLHRSALVQHRHATPPAAAPALGVGPAASAPSSPPSLPAIPAPVPAATPRQSSVEKANVASPDKNLPPARSRPNGAPDIR